MRRCLSFLCFSLLLAGTCGVSLVEQRHVSTSHVRYGISDKGWPKGLFYGIEDALYWLRFRDGRLLVNTLSEGKIDRGWIADLSDTPDNLRMTDVTSDSRHALFVLFSGGENLIVRRSLDGSGEIRRVTLSLGGHAHTIRYVADLEAVAVVIGQALALIVNEDGTFNRIGPEPFHGNNCCTYATAAVNEKTVALNVDGGLRLYSRGLEQTIWRESQSLKGYIREVASTGEGWAAIERGHEGASDGIRMFLPHDTGFDTYLSPLPMADGSLGMADEEWRITDYGHQAIVWSRRSNVLFRILGRFLESFRLDEETPQGRVCPGYSNNVFLIDSEGYTMMTFD